MISLPAASNNVIHLLITALKAHSLFPCTPSAIPTAAAVSSGRVHKNCNYTKIMISVHLLVAKVRWENSLCSGTVNTAASQFAEWCFSAVLRSCMVTRLWRIMLQPFCQFGNWNVLQSYPKHLLPKCIASCWGCGNTCQSSQKAEKLKQGWGWDRYNRNCISIHENRSL